MGPVRPPLPGPVPWLAIAQAEARRFHGLREADIQVQRNYAREVGTGRTSMVGSENAWCAAFANWCLREAGFAIENAGWFDHAGALGRAMGFLQVAGPGSDKSHVVSATNPLYRRLQQPCVGAIAVVPRSSGAGWHVGFAVGMASPTDVVLLGGNQDDRVCYAANPVQVGSGAHVRKATFCLPEAYLDGPPQAEAAWGVVSVAALNTGVGIGGAVGSGTT